MLYVLNEDFEILGTIPTFQTLIWNRKYYETGIYELHVGPELFPLLNSGKYLYRNDSEELGIINNPHCERADSGEYMVYVKGYFAERILYNRVIEKTHQLSGNVEEAMRKMVNDYGISPSDKKRVIAHLKLGNRHGITDTIDSQNTGDTVSDALYNLGAAYDITHSIRYDFLTNNLLFEVWKGKDRRDTQDVNDWAIFSDTFNNVQEEVYDRDDSEYKNFAYVAWQEEGRDRIVVEVDQTNGQERRELYVDVRDVNSQDEDGNPIAESVIKEQLKQRGIEALAENQIVESMIAGAISTKNLVYKKDFDLGDICPYLNQRLGIIMDARITEIVETYEDGKEDLQITFGNGQVEKIEKVVRRVMK